MEIMSKIYALYKGETNLMDGTITQIAYRRGVNCRSILFLLTPAYHKRSKGKNNLMALVPIEDGD